MKGRVFSVAVRCTECIVPVYEPLDRNQMYRILTTNFIADGGDEYDMIVKHRKNHETGESFVISPQIG